MFLWGIFLFSWIFLVFYWFLNHFILKLFIFNAFLLFLCFAFGLVIWFLSFFDKIQYWIFHCCWWIVYFSDKMWGILTFQWLANRDWVVNELCLALKRSLTRTAKVVSLKANFVIFTQNKLVTKRTFSNFHSIKMICNDIFILLISFKIICGLNGMTVFVKLMRLAYNKQMLNKTIFYTDNFLTFSTSIRADIFGINFDKRIIFNLQFEIHFFQQLQIVNNFFQLISYDFIWDVLRL